uniref:Mitochondrial cytochrome c oxidase subunit VIc/VIIs domain-containing protein n=1 Tax=Meloidogyne floridensis TaxID=298350 RepID=A0A915NS64_9BILA
MSTTAGRIPRPPEHIMRYPLHNVAKVFGNMALASSFLSAIAYAYFYVLPRRHQYRVNYDPYEEMRRICAYPKKYMITCPTVLAEKLKEKGIEVGDYPELSTPMGKEEKKSKSVEEFSE